MKLFMVLSDLLNTCYVHRWLNNNQAAADSANFMKNVKFKGIDEDLTSPHTPWIYYGVCTEVP